MRSTKVKQPAARCIEPILHFAFCVLHFAFVRRRSAPGSRIRSSRRGLTLIELLAATALASLMLVAASGVLGLLSRQHREIMSQERREPWQRQFVDQLEWDFANARHYEAATRQLTLIGYGGRDFVTHATIFCSAEVRYEVLELAGRSCLVRREIHPDDRALDNSRAEVVCTDVVAINVRSLGAANRGNRPPPPGTIPNRVRITLRRASSEDGIDDVLIVF